MVAIYHKATEFGYRPTYLLNIISERGGLAAARQLLRPGDPASGLWRLCQEGRLDISVEALVLCDRWRPLFTDEELAEADRRLRELGYDPGTAY